MKSEPVIVYFDGVCGLCNLTVDWLLSHDNQRVLRFAPLQGETAFERLPLADTRALESLVVSKNDKVFRHSDAVIEILLEIREFRHLGQVLRIIPRPLRDLAYGWVARYRYKIWGKRETCRLPSPAEREQFLP